MAMVSPAEMAARLGIDRSRVYRLAERYNIGTKLDNGMRVYNEEDIVEMQRHSTGVPGRPVKLSDSLTLAADAAEERAREAIRDGDSESAKTTLRIAAHLTRLANTHRASGNDPIQQIAPEQAD